MEHNVIYETTGQLICFDAHNNHAIVPITEYAFQTKVCLKLYTHIQHIAVSKAILVAALCSKILIAF